MPFVFVEAPVVYINPPSQTLRPGDTLRLRCLSQGDLDIQVEWSKSERQMSPSAIERDGVLEIPGVTAADAGRYRCLAVSATGRTEVYAEVTVIGKLFLPRSL